MATVKTENETSFATCWMAANAELMNAIANPSRLAFEAAHAEAIRAISHSFSSQTIHLGSGATEHRTVNGSGVEWEMGQSLARLITDVARENGYTIR